MEGFYTNARREKYGKGVLGPDFIVDGLGDFEHITHVEIKNPVGSAIRIATNLSPSISQQGKHIGKKILYQQSFWSDPNKRAEIPNINSTGVFRASPENVLGTIK